MTNREAGTARSGPAPPGQSKIARDEATKLIGDSDRIFIAYSHTDLKQARKVRQRLLRIRRSEAAESVFLDQDIFQRRDAQVQKDIVPVGLKFRLGVSIIHAGRELPQVVGNLTEPISQAVDIPESLDILAVTLLIGSR